MRYVGLQIIIDANEASLSDNARSIQVQPLNARRPAHREKSCVYKANLLAAIPMVPDFDPATRLNESLNAGAGRNLDAPPHERGRESVRNVGIGARVEPRRIFNQQYFAAEISKDGSELATRVRPADNGNTLRQRRERANIRIGQCQFGAGD
jgi:hypothetical protein